MLMHNSANLAKLIRQELLVAFYEWQKKFSGYCCKQLSACSKFSFFICIVFCIVFKILMLDFVLVSYHATPTFQEISFHLLLGRKNMAVNEQLTIFK